MEYKIVLGNLQDTTADVLINWCFPDLKSGPDFFADVIKKADNQVYYSLSYYRGYLKPSDCVSTINGALRCNIIFHSVVPQVVEKYNDTFSNLFNSLTTYGKENLCRTIAISIPDYRFLPAIMVQMNAYFPELKSLREVIIYCKSEAQQDLLLREVEKYKRNKRSIIQKIKGFLDEFTHNR